MTWTIDSTSKPSPWSKLRSFVGSDVRVVNVAGDHAFESWNAPFQIRMQGPKIMAVSHHDWQPLRTMEHLDEYSTYVLSAVGAATLYFLYLLLRTDAEAPVPYNVTPPEQAQPGWRGQVLQEPTLKVGALTRHIELPIDNSRSLARHSSNATLQQPVKPSGASTHLQQKASTAPLPKPKKPKYNGRVRHSPSAGRCSRRCSSSSSRIRKQSQE